jgi:hypothetical protein
MAVRRRRQARSKRCIGWEGERGKNERFLKDKIEANPNHFEIVEGST